MKGTRRSVLTPHYTTPAVISGITLSNASFVGGSASGTAIGTIGVTMSSGSFTGTLSLSGTNSASFQIVGLSLQTNGIVPSGPYNINIVATQAGATGSPFTQPEVINGTFTITGVTLSNLTFTGGAPSGTVIGTIGVTMASGSFSGSLSISGTNASSFQIVGTSLQTSGVVGNGVYNINIVATQSGAAGSPFTQAEVITGSGGSVIPYTSVSPTSLTLTTGAVSPLGWTVDFFDDYTGTFARNSPTWPPANQGFTTGAQYLGSAAQYLSFWNTAGWGGYGSPHNDTLNLVSMSNSRLIMPVTLTGGTPNVSSVMMLFNTVWGLWEISFKGAVPANGSLNGVGNGIWFVGETPWPTMGEMDVQETGFGATGYASFIHVNTTTSDASFSPGSSSTLPGGAHINDGQFHIYSTLLTPSYIALYIDGARQWITTDARALKNLTTATNPPTSTGPGSFGWHAAGLHTNPSFSDFFWGWIFGLGWNMGSGAPTAAQLPMQAEVDWIRHSLLNPATGGPHV